MVTKVVIIDSENVTEIFELFNTEESAFSGEVEETFGVVVSTTNELIFNVTLLLPLSVTVIEQSEYVPSLKEFNVIVLLSFVAEVELEEQEPP